MARKMIRETRTHDPFTNQETPTVFLARMRQIVRDVPKGARNIRVTLCSESDYGDDHHPSVEVTYDRPETIEDVRKRAFSRMHDGRPSYGTYGHMIELVEASAVAHEWQNPFAKSRLTPGEQ